MSARNDGSRRFPPRPTLTSVFASAALFWAACALVYSTGYLREPGENALVAGAALALGAVSLASAAFKRTRMLGIVLASLAMGAGIGSAQSALIQVSAAELLETGSGHAVLTLIEDSRDYGFGETALAEATLEGVGPVTVSARLGTIRPMLCGERLEAKAAFSSVDYESGSYAWSEGSCGNLDVTEPLVVDAPFPLDRLISLRSRAIERIGAQDDAHALLQALVCGYRRNIAGTDLYAEFQTCGLAHLVAVSGAHLVIVTGLFASVLKALHVTRKPTICVLVAAMGAYYVIAGMPVSALRAAIMSALGLFAFFGKRRSSSLNAVGIGLFAIIGTSPQASVSASLALSALSTLGILVFAPLVSAWLERTPLGRVTLIADALSMTLAASLLSQPYACSLFHQLPLVSPLANVACAPLFPLVCGTGLIGGLLRACITPAPESLLVPGLAADLLARIVGALARLPYASVPVAIATPAALALTAAVALGIWAWWPRSGKKALACFASAAVAVALAFVVTVDASDRVIALDIGQGDAILVSSRGQTMLVDTGNQDSRLLEQLAAVRTVHLDSVLVTHADDDHCGSLDALEKSIDVQRVVLARAMTSCEDPAARKLVEQAAVTAREIVGVEVGDRFRVGAFGVRVVWPRSFTDGGNADSLCVVLDYDGNDDGITDSSVLMTGDAEKEQLAEMIAAGLVGDVDVLKVGHHGSRNGATAAEFSQLKPEIALISCGAHNRYGHPTPETLSLLDDVGAATYRTDQDGRITCRFTSDRITVSTSPR